MTKIKEIDVFINEHLGSVRGTLGFHFPPSDLDLMAHWGRANFSASPISDTFDPKNK